MGRPYKCPYCGQSESVGKGVRKTKTIGDRRIRLCKGCGRKFTPKNQKVGAEISPPEQKCGAETAEHAVEAPTAEGVGSGVSSLSPAAAGAAEPAPTPAVPDGPTR